MALPQLWWEHWAVLSVREVSAMERYTAVERKHFLKLYFGAEESILCLPSGLPCCVECCVQFLENWSSLCLEVCLRQQIYLLRNGKHIFLSIYKYTCLLIWYYGHNIKPFRLIYKVARTAVMKTAGFMLSTVCSAPFFLRLTVVEICGFGLL